MNAKSRETIRDRKAFFTFFQLVAPVHTSFYMVSVVDVVLNRFASFEAEMWLPPFQKFASLSGFDCHPLHDWVKENHYVTPVAAVVAYVLLIFIVLPLCRWKAATVVPSWMRHLFAAWNLLLSLFSCYGLYVCLPFVWRMVTERSFRYAICSDHMMLGGQSGDDHVACYGQVGYMMTLFMFSKFPELLDTVFLVLMRKNVLFLHWYHHITVLLYSWFAYQSATPSAVLFGTMNYAVHSVMYFYFFASQYTHAFAFMRQPITSMQLLQMVVGVGVTVTAYVFDGDAKGCSRTYRESGFFTFCLVLYGSYMLLFAKLYYDTYIGGSRQRRNLKRDAKKTN